MILFKLISIPRITSLLVNSALTSNYNLMSKNIQTKSMRPHLSSIAMNTPTYEQFGMGNDAKDFPSWSINHFKYSSYSEIKMLPLNSSTGGKFGHLINDNLMNQHGFRIRCFINDNSQLIGENDAKSVNISAIFPPEGVNTYHGFDLRTDATQLIILLDAGTHCCGHPGIWHGGFTSAILDNTFGFLGSCFFSLAATKSLNIKFIKPIPVGTPVIITTEYKPESIPIGGENGIITSEAYVYLPNQKLAATATCEMVDVSQKWNKVQ